MTDLNVSPARLRHLLLAGRTAPAVLYPLNPAADTSIGRDPRCQIVLDSQTYSNVSRQHAQISASAHSPSGWQICDLNSANGTYINGKRLRGCQYLQDGDRIVLAQGGPRFIFELQPAPTSSKVATLPERRLSGRALSHSADQPDTAPGDHVTVSQLFPILYAGHDLARKAYLLPGIVTAVFVVLMFISVGNSAVFNLLLAGYISSIAYFFVYQLCGKHKPWWVLMGALLLTVLLLVSPVLDLMVFLFRQVLPGAATADPSNFLLLLLQMFFGTGLMEELLKAAPVLLAAWLGMKLQSPWRERIGVLEPLDGILLGTASAIGFTLVETLSQYVPGIVSEISIQYGQEQGELFGLQLLIPRVLGSIAGHMAYSGYFGYFIGLSVLKPSKRWKILGIGYFTAAGLHALWNTMGMINFLVLAVVGVASYAFLAAAILKARAISPTRAENFATRFSQLR